MMRRISEPYSAACRPVRRSGLLTISASATPARAVAVGMHELAGILLHVQPLNGVRLEIGLLALLRHPDPDPAIAGDRLLLL